MDKSNQIHRIKGRPAIMFDRIQTLWDTHQYDMVYLSFGGKINESHISFNYPLHMSGIKYVTNSSYQLIPQFIRDRDTEHKIIVIAVDDFREESQFVQNRNVINNIISRDGNHIDVILFDHICSIEEISQIVDYMADQMVTRKMNETKCMICNYIKYSHPNLHEGDFEDKVPETIQQTLNKMKYHRYSACFYNWFGYSVYTYNIVYNYKKYMLYSYYSNIFSVLEKKLNGIHLSCMNMASVYSVINGPNIHPNQKRHFDDFLKNSFDITTFCTSFESMAEPIATYYAY